MLFFAAVVIFEFVQEYHNTLSLHSIYNTQSNEKHADSYIEYLGFKEDIMQNKTKKKIIVYLAFLIVFSSVFYFLILRAGTLAAAGG
ncbi:MAG: protease family protein, partial [Chloroflexota bacterium]|nr:protease family protein [Chloroflexota bacterium]